ncbi:MAG: 4Fe-4S binding protein [Conexivisphaerales archaeon]
MDSMFATPFIKNKIGVLRHSCLHNPSSGIKTCDPSELSNSIKDLHAKAIVIVGVYDESHLKLYREAALKAGVNPLLMRVVDYRWDNQLMEQNIAMLQHNWVADMAAELEVTVPVSRREVIKGSVKVGMDRIDKPVYIADQCRGLYRVCTLCQDSCPYGAINIDIKSGINIDYSKCSVCGLCTSVCPMSAIQFPSAPQQSIYDQTHIKGKKVISCYKHTGESLKVPCLAMLSAEDVLALRGSGELVLKCPGCELQSNLDGLKGIVKEINSLIGGITLEIPDGNQEPGVIKDFSLNLQNIANRAELRKTILDSHQHMSSLLFYNVTVDDDSCTMCESCAKWCPTSALKIEYNGERSMLTFEPAQCIGCKICVNVCPASCNKQSKVISVNRGQSERKTLAEDYMVKCRVCGAPVGSKKSLNHVKEVMEQKGIPVDDEWLERCQKHRSEYSFKMMLGMNAQFRPRGASHDV